MTEYTIYDATTGLIRRSGVADRPDWHLLPGEALLVGQMGERGWYVVDGVIVPPAAVEGAKL